MNLKDLNKLQEIEDKLAEIRGILNPEDSPYICDTIVTNIADEDLADLVKQMMVKMGYDNKVIKRIEKMVVAIQS